MVSLFRVQLFYFGVSFLSTAHSFAFVDREVVWSFGDSRALHPIAPLFLVIWSLLFGCVRTHTEY